MCRFFSFCSDGDGNPLFFNAEQRKKLQLEGCFDSHTTIADFYGYKGEKEDRLNKYEYNHLT